MNLSRRLRCPLSDCIPAFTIEPMNSKPELLLSLPPVMCQQLADYHPDLSDRAFATFDPPGAQLGSGGGTAHVLHQAWKNDQAKFANFSDWISNNQRVVLHGGGESRRLPSYAAIGKLLMPFPVLRWSRGQQLGQTLLDMNEPFLRTAFQQSADSAKVMIASGDVLLRSKSPIPQPVSYTHLTLPTIYSV